MAGGAIQTNDLYATMFGLWMCSPATNVDDPAGYQVWIGGIAAD